MGVQSRQITFIAGYEMVNPKLIKNQMPFKHATLIIAYNAYHYRYYYYDHRRQNSHGHDTLNFSISRSH